MPVIVMSKTVKERGGLCLTVKLGKNEQDKKTNKQKRFKDDPCDSSERSFSPGWLVHLCVILVC